MGPTTALAPTTRTARPEEREEVIALCLAAFADEAVTQWLVPDAAARAAVMAEVFRASLGTAIEAGSVILALGAEGRPVAASIWIPRTRDGAAGPSTGDDPGTDETPPADPGPRGTAGEDPTPAAPGPGGTVEARLRVVEEATALRRPTSPHLHLDSMGTLPSHRGTGAGGALISAGLARAAELGLPARLEASTPGSRRLYLRHGFRDDGGPIVLPEGGPRLQPMWREA